MKNFFLRIRFPHFKTSQQQHYGNIQISVADPGCLSWILDPDFLHSGSRIQQVQKEGKKLSLPFVVAINFTNLKIFIFERSKKFKLSHTEIEVFLTQKLKALIN
jgi:hypothetical protein